MGSGPWAVGCLCCWQVLPIWVPLQRVAGPGRDSATRITHPRLATLCVLQDIFKVIGDKMAAAAEAEQQRQQQQQAAVDAA